MALIILLIGVFACVLPTLALEGYNALGLPDVVIQLVPFLVLAALVRSLSRIGFGVLTVLLTIGTVANQVGVHTSEGSTASIALGLYPLLFAVGILLGLIIDQAVRDSSDHLRRNNPQP